MATSTQHVKDNHPSRDFDSIAQLGLKALGRADAHKAEIEPRVPPGLLVELTTDLGALGINVTGMEQAHTGAVHATEARDAAAEHAIDRVQGIRTVVRNAHATKDIQHAYGVGQTLHKRRVTQLLSIIGNIQQRLVDHPEDAADFGFLPADIDAMKLAKEDLIAAATMAQQKRAGAPLTTKDRNRVGNRILRSVQRIAGAGILAFASDPAVRAEFEALHVSPKKKSAKPKKPASPPAPAPVTP